MDNVQIPYNPSKVSTSGLFNVTGVAPGPPIFAILPVAQASSVPAIDANASVPYIYLNQERYEFEFRPPILSMDELEIQLYRPPAPTTPSLLGAYDTRVYAASLDSPPSSDLTGALVTNKAPADQRSLPYFFTATVIGVKANRLLLGSASSTSAAGDFAQFLTQEGLLPTERGLYGLGGEFVGAVSSLVGLTTQTTLNLEFECQE